MICPHCEIHYRNEDVNFCSECGTKLIKCRSLDETEQFPHKETHNHDYGFGKDVMLADEIYNQYRVNGINRVDKINGRLLASQTVKLDTIIQQNSKIIELLEIIANK